MAETIPPPVTEALPVEQSIALIDEINERATSRQFYGINGVLHAKLCTIRATLARHRAAAEQRGVEKCPTCDLSADDERGLFCSNAFHLSPRTPTYWPPPPEAGPFKLLIDLEAALVLTREHNPHTSVADFVDRSSEFAAVQSFFHANQHDVPEAGPPLVVRPLNTKVIDDREEAIGDTQAGPPLGEVERLREALDGLQQAEATYRSAHDRHGDGSSKAGRAWDLLRRAGDKARAALASLPRDEWRGIESAPKDGSSILGFFPNRQRTYAGGRGTTSIHWSGWGGGIWELSHSGLRCTSESPTHWRPLPEPPARAMEASDGQG